MDQAFKLVIVEETRERGGPDVYTFEDFPAAEWNGVYEPPRGFGGGSNQENWYWGRHSQIPTVLSVLTPEYQERMTQMNYHEAVNNAPQWMASFCYPEGLMRWWYVWGIRDMEVLVTPNQVQSQLQLPEAKVCLIIIGLRMSLHLNQQII